MPHVLLGIWLTEKIGLGIATISFLRLVLCDFWIILHSIFFVPLRLSGNLFNYEIF